MQEEYQMNIFDFIENPNDTGKWICVDSKNACYHDEACKNNTSLCCKYCKDMKCKSRCEVARKVTK